MRIRILVIAMIALFDAARAQEGDPIAKAAGAYASYRADLAALTEAPPAAPGDLERALDRIAGYNADDLVRGWIAYGALLAARSPAYASGIASVRKRYGRAMVVGALARNPRYPGRRRGYADAISLILNGAAADNAAARAAGGALDAAAGRLDWGDTETAENRAAKLRASGAARRDYGEAPAPLVAPHQAKLRLAPGHVGVARRMTALAGLRVLGGGAAMDELLEDKPTRECIIMQQLQFYQCVSVTHDAGEAQQCLAEYPVRGIANCFGSIVG